MSIEDIIARGTWKPAMSIKREDLGNLSEGSVADVALLSIVKGRFGYVDSGNNRIEGDQKIEAEMTTGNCTCSGLFGAALNDDIIPVI